MNTLTRLELHGLKSIKDLSLTLGRMNVLIGANGAGKSNLLSFFRLLSWMTSSPGRLQTYVGKYGGANALLHDGAAVTPEIAATLEFETDKGTDGYEVRLLHAAPDTLIFAEEQIRYSRPEMPGTNKFISMSSTGHREAMLIEKAEEGHEAARVVRDLLRQCVVYQFHNTSETARIRQRWDTQDNRHLKEDGANLAPFLLRLRASQPLAYRRIVSTIRQVLPFFADFFLEPTNGMVLLQWQERDTDVVFGSHQASDGALRLMALLALLLQPTEEVPDIVILDEPELGLHPYAINVVAGLVKSASIHKQIILATQSMTFIDYFDPEEIIVVNRRGRESELVRLDPGPLQEWLDEYSLSELWEKNVIGGRPSR
jgi:predicted ATPase